MVQTREFGIVDKWTVNEVLSVTFKRFNILQLAFRLVTLNSKLKKAFSKHTLVNKSTVMNS